MRGTIYKIGMGCLLALTAAVSHASMHWLASDHPQTYTVQEGDTLWDISGRFLKDPWRWPEVWEASDIANPNLIYPGDIIILKVDGDMPKLTLQRGTQTQRVVQQHGQRVVKLSPRVRAEPADRAIPTIPISVIGPFLTRSEITQVGELEQYQTISSVDEERLLVTEGNRFYVANLGIPEGEAVRIFRPGKILVHPETGEEVGQEAIYLGSAKVEVRAKMSTLVLQNVVEEIRAGDYVLPNQQERIEPYYYPKYPHGEAQGFILSVLGGVNQVGKNQVITITGGQDIGRDEGDVLSVLQTKSDLPSRVRAKEKFGKRMNPRAVEQYEFTPIEVGRVIVFKVFDRTSLALVMDAVRSIHLRDEVRKP